MARPIFRTSSERTVQTLGQVRGFTIVELLIVIVVIAILAALVMVSYRGITQAADENSIRNDLSSAERGLANYKATHDNYPGTLGEAGVGSDGSMLTYNVSGDGLSYCLAGARGEISLGMTSGNRAAAGTCNGSSFTLAGTTENAGVVTTLAGSTSGYADGTGSAAQFANPVALAVDSAGNVFVGDYLNYRIRKVTSDGAVTTFAGSGGSGYADGVGTEAQLRGSGVAIDSSDNIYVAEYNNRRVRKITPAGVVTTLAGSGSIGSADGTGTAASFYNLRGAAVDASGNVYVADNGNHRIRKITPAGVVTTLAGSTSGYADGTGSAAQFSGPWGVAVDASGNVYVTDSFNQRIRKITPAGVVTTLAGSGAAGFADGTGTAAQFNSPQGIAVDTSGRVYVADSQNRRIRKITPGGVVTTLAGSGVSGFADGVGTAAQFNLPVGLAMDASGRIYVADQGGQRIRKIE